MRKGRRKKKIYKDLPRFTQFCKEGRKELVGYIGNEQYKIPVYQSNIRIPTIDL